MVVAFIIGCEIGFWLFVAAGLVCRYLLRMRRLGALLLFCTPLVDLALLLATVADLRSGATASFTHGLAAIYIGASVAFGHRMIRWADERFAHRFAGGPPPAPKPRYGVEHARRERQMWFLHMVGWAIGCLLLYGMIAVTGDSSRTEALLGTIRTWSAVLGIDFLYSFSYTLWPRKAKS